MNFFKNKRIYILISIFIYIITSGCAIKTKPMGVDSLSKVQFIDIYQNEFIDEKSDKDLMKLVRFPVPKSNKSQLEAVNYLLEITDYKFVNNFSDVDLNLIPVNPFWIDSGLMSIYKSLMFMLSSNQFLVIDHKNKLITIYNSKQLMKVKSKPFESEGQVEPSNEDLNLLENKKSVIKEDSKILNEPATEIVEKPIEEHPVLLVEPPKPYLVEKGITLSLAIQRISIQADLKPKFNFKNQWLKNIVFTKSYDLGTDVEKAVSKLLTTLNNNQSLIDRNIKFSFSINKNKLELTDE